MRSSRQKNIKILSFIYKLLSFFLITSSIFFLGSLIYIGILPNKYLIILAIIIIVFNLINVFLLNYYRTKPKVKKHVSLYTTFGIVLMCLISFYMLKTVGILKNSEGGKYKTENYLIISLNSNNYKSIDEINNTVIGYYKSSEGIELAKKQLLKDYSVNFEIYNSYDDMIEALLNNKVKFVLLEESIKNILSEEIPDFDQSINIINKFKVKIESDTEVKEANVTEEPFSVYISGIDTYGEISSVSRSDVNMVMVVNPKTHNVLLISVPRDYYVQLHGTIGPKDKLTHAGIYGIDMSVETLEDLLELDINYYIKVNFTSIIDLVDAIGGLDVYSEYSFISYSDFRFKEGMNFVNGEQALDFARTRKAFVDGDRQRGKNQQAVIEALIRKLTKKSIITKYNSILDAINGKYETNMSTKKIISLIKMQLNDMPAWTVTSYSLEGYDAIDYTYTYNKPLYVMKPDEDSVKEAIDLIDQMLNDIKLENSYEDNITDNISKVVKVNN